MKEMPAHNNKAEMATRIFSILIATFSMVLAGSFTLFGKITFPERFLGNFKGMEEIKGSLNDVPVTLVSGIFKGKPERALRNISRKGYLGKGKNYALIVDAPLEKILRGEIFTIKSGMAFQNQNGESNVFVLKLEDISIDDLSRIFTSYPSPPDIPHCSGGYGFYFSSENSRFFVSVHEEEREQLLAQIEGQDFLKDYIKVTPYHFISRDKNCTFSIVPAGGEYACVTSCL